MTAPEHTDETSGGHAHSGHVHATSGASPVGTLAWGRQRKGVLTLAEKLSFVANAALHDVRQQARRLKPKDQAKLARLSDADLVLPDTPAAHHAQALCAQLSPPFLLNHCFRTYFWGVLLGGVEGLKPDKELLFVAAMLHDLGHTEPFLTDERQHCFAIAGAEAAEGILSRLGWNPQRCACVSNAIALHMNVAPTPLMHGAEARLLQAGAACDVVGARFDELHPQATGTVVHRYPRLDFKCAFSALMHTEANRQPGTRVAIIDGLGLRGRIARSPFKE